MISRILHGDKVHFTSFVATSYSTHRAVLIAIVSYHSRLRDTRKLWFCQDSSLSIHSLASPLLFLHVLSKEALRHRQSPSGCSWGISISKSCSSQCRKLGGSHVIIEIEPRAWRRSRSFEVRQHAIVFIECDASEGQERYSFGVLGEELCRGKYHLQLLGGPIAHNKFLIQRVLEHVCFKAMVDVLDAQDSFILHVQKRQNFEVDEQRTVREMVQLNESRIPPSETHDNCMRYVWIIWMSRCLEDRDSLARWVEMHVELAMRAMKHIILVISGAANNYLDLLDDPNCLVPTRRSRFQTADDTISPQSNSLSTEVGTYVCAILEAIHQRYPELLYFSWLWLLGFIICPRQNFRLFKHIARSRKRRNNITTAMLIWFHSSVVHSEFSLYRRSPPQLSEDITN